MEVKITNWTQVSPKRRNVIHHLSNPPNVVVGRTQELNQALKRVLPEHPSTTQMASQLGEPGIGIREHLPHISERNAGVEEVEQGRSGIGVGTVIGAGVKAVADVAVLEMLEG